MNDTSAPKKKYGNQTRIILYAPSSLKKSLKTKLFLDGTTMSEWFRAKAIHEIESTDQPK